MGLLVLDVTVSIHMVDQTLLPRQHVKTLFEMALHFNIDFHLRPCEFRGYQLTRLVVLGQDTPEHREVRTLCPVKHPAHQTVSLTIGRTRITRKTLL